jgi:zinc and cadmium transporter
MSHAWLGALLSVVAVSAISLLGVVTLSWAPARLHRITDLLVSFAIGALLGDAFLHLLPEAFDHGHRSSLEISVSALVGIGAFFLLERLVRHRLYHLHEHQTVRPVVWMNVVGDGLHNLVDGMLIGASWATGDTTLAVATTIAVVAHEIPQEIGDFGILVHGGLSVRKAIVLNLLSGLTAVVGAVGILLLHDEMHSVQDFLMPFTAGCFIYISAADLIPELQHEQVTLKTSMVQLVLISAGIAVMAALRLFPGHAH